MLKHFGANLFTDQHGQVVIPADADRIISKYLLTMMFGGYYDAHDVLTAYSIMNYERPVAVHEDIDPVDSLFQRAEMLLYTLSGHYKYNLQ
jgi:hypothetical protein